MNINGLLSTGAFKLKLLIQDKITIWVLILTFGLHVVWSIQF